MILGETFSWGFPVLALLPLSRREKKIRASFNHVFQLKLDECVIRVDQSKFTKIASNKWNLQSHSVHIRGGVSLAA